MNLDYLKLKQCIGDAIVFATQKLGNHKVTAFARDSAEAS